MDTKLRAGLFPVIDKTVLSRNTELGARHYVTKHVCQMTGVAPRTLAYWVSEGVLSDQDVTLGKGYRRSFSVRDIVELCIVKEMFQLSMSVSTMKEVITELTKSGYFNRLGNVDREHEVALVYVGDNRQVILKNGKSCDTWLNGRKAYLVLRLPMIEDDVDRLIRNESEVSDQKAVETPLKKRTAEASENDSRH